MQKVNVNDLKPHPKNSYFFDDMTGQKWTEFLDSVRTSGVIEPIVCTQEKVIVSGHQRARACKELDIKTVNCEVRIYDDEDKVIKDLIETNVRQRGDISSSSLKMGRIICELERIYGVSKGRPELNTTNGRNKTQDEIAEELGLSVKDLQRFKKLTTLIPEMQDMLETDSISMSVASRVLARLSPEDQSALLEDLGKDQLEQMTQRQVQQYVDRIGELEAQLSQNEEHIEAEIITDELYWLKENNKTLEMNNSLLKKELKRKPVVIEVQQATTPDLPSFDIEYFNAANEMYMQLINMYASKVTEFSKLADIDRKLYSDSVSAVIDQLKKLQISLNVRKITVA